MLWSFIFFSDCTSMNKLLTKHGASEELLNDILSSSEIKFKYIPFFNGLYLIDNNLVSNSTEGLECNEGKINHFFSYTSQEKSKKIYIGTVSKKKYLAMWLNLLEKDVWNLRSMDPIKIIDESSDPEHVLKFYKDLRIEIAEIEFCFQIKKRKHIFKVYDIKLLKDQRYLKILRIICKAIHSDYIYYIH